MYVTRRLLRSTLPPESTSKKEDNKLVPFLPPPTPKRRAAKCASTKTCQVIADASDPAARSRAAKASQKQTENRGDKKNRNSSHKKKERKQEQENQVVDVSNLHGYQLMVDVLYRGDEYAEARILDVDVDKKLLFVHYMGWNARYDNWVEEANVVAHGSHSGAAKKKDVSWDGITSLFALEEEIAAQKVAGKIKKQVNSRHAISPKARQSARKALRNINEDCKKVEKDEKILLTKSTRPNSKVQVTKVKKLAIKSPKVKNVSSSSRKTPRRVQVAVGTTDEDSERKNGNEAADLVLDIEIEGHKALNEEVEEDTEIQDKLSKRIKSRRNSWKASPSRSKRKRDLKLDDVKPAMSVNKRSPGSKKKRLASDEATDVEETMPFISPSQRSGANSDTREKLAAIFRLRVQQKQQMEQMNGTSFQQSLQDSAVEMATSNSATESEKDAGTDIAMVNAEVAAAEEYQRQLQQFYFHQQMALTNSLSMSVTGKDDPNLIPLQGGIMDPRIIQERLTALEERRRQQAHVQAYYHQLMLTRERNVRALAANQAFMAASAAVWEQQLRKTQSDDGSSSVTSWKDVTGADVSEKAESTSPALSEGGEVDSESSKECSASTTAASEVKSVTSPDTVEKTADGSTSSTNTSPAKSISAKCDPVDEPTPGVLYEFVL